jgi:ankyrin repeat protein
MQLMKHVYLILMGAVVFLAMPSLQGMHPAEQQKLNNELCERLDRIDQKLTLWKKNQHEEFELRVLGLLQEAMQLIKQGADPRSTNKKGDTLLHYVACSDSVHDMLKPLLEIKWDEKKIAWDTNNTEGVTPLCKAIVHGAIANAKLLIEKGADAKYWRSTDGETLLWFCDNVELFQILLKHIHSDRVNRSGRTVLMDMAQNGKPHIIDCLLKDAANYIACDNQGNTALEIACLQAKKTGLSVEQKNNYQRCIDLLLDPQKKEHLNKKLQEELDIYPESLNIDWQQVKLLVKCGADVNLRGFNGMHPLKYAYLCKNLDAFRFFLDVGADPALPNWNSINVDPQNPFGKLFAGKIAQALPGIHVGTNYSSLLVGGAAIMVIAGCYGLYKWFF